MKQTVQFFNMCLLKTEYKKSKCRNLQWRWSKQTGRSTTTNRGHLRHRYRWALWEVKGHLCCNKWSRKLKLRASFSTFNLKKKKIHRKRTEKQTGSRRPYIALVWLDSSASVEYPDWMKEVLWRRIQGKKVQIWKSSRSLKEVEHK